MIDLDAPIGFLLTTVGAIISAAMSVRHAFGMLIGTRSSRETLSQLLPFLYFALPGTLDAQGRAHRSRLLLWLLATATFAAIAALIQFFFRP